MAKTKTTLCKLKNATGNAKLPGTIYARNGRYWYKVQFPGEAKFVACPLVLPGSKYATTDPAAAVELAQNIFYQSIYKHHNLTEIQGITNIASLVAAYLTYADHYYADEHGQPNKEANNMRYCLKPLTDLFAALPVDAFGPLRLIEARDRMIQLDWSRKLINQRINCIRRMFKWAVSRQLISPIIYQGLMTVEPLKQGRCKARESEKRKPVDEKNVYAVLPYTTPVVAAMIELQFLTGMRPGELVIMRPCDIDRTEAVWHYSPQRHKNQYRGTERIVSIGPRGQELLRPFLLRGGESPCFSPAESEKYRREKLSQQRKTPKSCGNIPGSAKKRNPKKNPGQLYDTMAYGNAVDHAINACNKEREKQAEAAGIKPELIPHWTPYQLRHTAATKVRKEMGYETAGATLGHTNMSATAIYAERNQGLADEAARRFG